MRFESPCISSGWSSYHGYVGVFALAAVFFIQLVELAVLSHLERKHSQQQQDANSDSSVIKTKDVEAGCVVKQSPDGHAHMMIEDSKDLRNVSTIVLELGIVMHSVIIGLTLGFSSGEGFNALLIALVFHQVIN